MKILRYFLITLLFCIFFESTFAEEKNAEQLIIFENADKTRVQKLFHDQVLPKLIDLTKSKGISIILKSTQKGIPEEITTLPAIIFQNSLGRSIYRGRFTQISRIANFIQTSKYVPQKKTPLTFDSLAIKKDGRAKIAFPIKISSVTGTAPADYDDKNFKLKMREIIIKNLKDVELKKGIRLQPLDKLFYFDFYPWVSDKGDLYLSGKIFSQHHCKKFIWETGASPIVNNWKNREQSFQKLTVEMMKQLNDILDKEVIGDSFDVVDSQIPIMSWEQLNLPLPVKKNKFKNKVNLKIPSKWELKGKLDKNSLAQFAIAPPNDNYSGTIKKISGEFHFGKNGKLALSKGWFEADMLSISMGEPDLDDSLQEEDMFFISKFAKSKIILSPIDSSEVGQLKLGEESQVKVKGLLNFKGLKETLSVDLSFEPTIDENGEVKLFLKAQFEFDVTKFGMEGAPGKHEKRNTVQFFIRIYMNPIKN